MAYSYPNITNSSTILDLFTYTNDILNGMLGIGLLGVIFFVSFITFKNYTTERALTVSLFITTITGIFMFILGWITEETLMIPVVLMIGSLGYLYFKR